MCLTGQTKPRLKKRGKLANSFFFWPQALIYYGFAVKTEFANRGKLSGKLANSFSASACQPLSSPGFRRRSAMCLAGGTGPLSERGGVAVLFAGHPNLLFGKLL